MILTFEKDSLGAWHIVLPDYKGHKDDLAMVRGADTMCDIYAQGEDKVSIQMSAEPIEKYSGKLDFALYTFREENYAIDGARYFFTSSLSTNFDIWLCDVTTEVFGTFPKTIWIY
jgi:hypothetical protein